MIIFCGDNGRCHLRAKNWLYEPRLKVPLIIKFRNYVPELGYTESKYTREHRPIRDEMLRLHAEGKLTAAQSLVLLKTKPTEELYDLQSDPHEIRNLADDRAHAAVKRQLAAHLARWIKTTNDTGLGDIAP